MTIIDTTKDVTWFGPVSDWLIFFSGSALQIRTKDDRDAEIKRMWSEHSSETQMAEEKNPELNEGELYGEKKYDLSPVTTYEYDVVACADFVEEKGCWVRNMPQEIKDANPNFVPS